MEDPSVTLISPTNIIFRKQPRKPCAQRGAVYPSLTGAHMLHWRGENKVPWYQLQLIFILGNVWVHHLQSLGTKREECLDISIFCSRHGLCIASMLHQQLFSPELCRLLCNLGLIKPEWCKQSLNGLSHSGLLSKTYLMICKSDIPREENSKPITTELDFNSSCQFLQGSQMAAWKVVG